MPKYIVDTDALTVEPYTEPPPPPPPPPPSAGVDVDVILDPNLVALPDGASVTKPALEAALLGSWFQVNEDPNPQVQTIVQRVGAPPLAQALIPSGGAIHQSAGDRMFVQNHGGPGAGFRMKTVGGNVASAIFQFSSDITQQGQDAHRIDVAWFSCFDGNGNYPGGFVTILEGNPMRLTAHSSGGLPSNHDPIGIEYTPGGQYVIHVRVDVSTDPGVFHIALQDGLTGAFVGESMIPMKGNATIDHFRCALNNHGFQQDADTRWGVIGISRAGTFPLVG